VKVVADPERRLFFEGIGVVERPLEVTPELTGWLAPTARAYRYGAGQVVDGDAEGDEMVMVVLWGELALCATGVEERVCVRRDPFRDPATVLYLPPGGSYRAEVLADAHVLYCRAPGTAGAAERPARLIEADPARPEILDGAVSEQLRIRENVVAAASWATLPLDGAGRGIVYHRFSRPDGFALTAEIGNEATRVNDGDAIVRASAHYQVAVAPAADLLAVTVTAA
jgi:hypothetical protein